MGQPQRLGALDAAFLNLERRGTPFVVGAVLLFERGPLARPDGRVDFAGVREYVAAEIDRLPRYRQRLTRGAGLGHPVWVDDERFDLDRHLRFTALPAGSGEDEDGLRAFVGRLLSEELPANHPPWQLWLVDGVPGDAVAVIAKVHHTLVDGVSGVALLARLLRFAPDERAPERAAWSPEPSPPPQKLLREEIAHRVAGLRDLGRSLPGGTARRLVPGLVSLIARGLVPASAAGINPARVGRDRVYATCELDLAEIKRVKNRFGATVNDVALAVLAGALRRLLRERGVDADRLRDFRAMVPANTRAPGEETAAGTQVSLLLVPIPVFEADPRRRIDHVRETTRALKERSSQAKAGELLVRLSDVTSPRILSAVLNLALARRAFNVVVTNIPGPPVPLYLRGSRMLAFYPIVNLWPGGALGIALLSYAGTLYVGLHADAAVLPELDPLVSAIGESFAELRALAEPEAPRPPPAEAHPEARP